MNPLIYIKTKESDTDLAVITANIQEVRIISLGNKYKVQLTLLSGRSYFLLDVYDNEVFDTKAEAELVVSNFESLL